MGLIHSPSIITDGLVLALDAQNSRSYPGSGTAWTDITYRGNNGTLTNGPTFEPGGPFAGSAGGSVYFDGTGDYLSLNASSAFSFGVPSGNSNDFTIEWFKYWTTLSGFQTIWSNNYNYNPGLLIQTGNSDGKYRIYVSSNTLLFQETDAPVVGVWYHYALVRNGTTITLYRNGVSNGSGTSSNAAGSASDATTIGTSESGPLASYFENGYISNLRIVKGTALYTSNFTPPTKPLLPVTNTSLLTCQGGAIVDSSSNKFTITRNGDARAVKTAAINLDGTNDFVTVPRSGDFDFGTGNLTIESWVYLDTYDAEASALVYKTQSSGSAGLACGNSVGSAGLLFMLASDNTSYTVNVSGGTVTLNRWHHICMTRIGSTWTCYLNATQVSTATWAGSVSHVTTGSFGGIGIGAYTSAYGGDAGRYSMDGKVAIARIYNGKGFTATEVTQNFNAMRNRFGI